MLFRRPALVLVVAWMMAFAGCLGSGGSEPEPRSVACNVLPMTAGDPTAVQLPDGRLKYTMEVDGGPAAAGATARSFATHLGDKPDDDQFTTLDANGRGTVTWVVPRFVDSATLSVGWENLDDCGSFAATVTPRTDFDDAPEEPSTEPTPSDPTPQDPTPQEPTPQEETPEDPEPCVAFITAITTGVQHYPDQSDAIYRVNVTANVPDGAKVGGLVDGKRIEGTVMNGTAELRHRVFSYGDYTLTDIDIASNNCMHDKAQDKESQATAGVR